MKTYTWLDLHNALLKPVCRSFPDLKEAEHRWVEMCLMQELGVAYSLKRVMQAHTRMTRCN